MFSDKKAGCQSSESIIPPQDDPLSPILTTRDGQPIRFELAMVEDILARAKLFAARDKGDLIAALSESGRVVEPNK